MSTTSRICRLDYQSVSVPSSQWLNIITACLAPLVVHIAAGVPNPIVIGGKESKSQSISKPPWWERLPHFNPVSILWRYYAIADRRARSKSWSKEEMAATNAVFWDGKRWDGSETIMIRSRTFSSVRSWRGVAFRAWWSCSMAALVGYAAYEFTSPMAAGDCMLVSQLLEIIFYALFTVGALFIHSFYVLRGQNRTTLIPCIQSLWYKVYTYLLIVVAIVGVAFACAETRQGWFVKSYI